MRRLVCFVSLATVLATSQPGSAQSRGPGPDDSAAGAAVGAAIFGGLVGGLLGAASARRIHHDDRMNRIETGFQPGRGGRAGAAPMGAGPAKGGKVRHKPGAR